MDTRGSGYARTLFMSKTSQRIVYALLALCVAAVFAVSCRDALHSPGIDLRGRIVGARRMLSGLDAYPVPTTPEPRPFFRLINDNTCPPTLLLLYAPLNRFPWAYQRFFFLALDWLCLGFLFMKCREWFPRAKSVTYCSIFVLFVIADFGLRLHMERGQYYVEIAALSAAVICNWLKPEKRWLGAVALAVLLLCRPTYLIVLAVLWVSGFRREVRIVALSGVVGAAMMLATFGLQPWIGYARSVKTLERFGVATVFTGSPRPLPAGEYLKVEGEDFSRSLSTNYAVGRTFIGLSGQASFRPLVSRVLRRPGVLVRFNTLLMCLAALYCCVVAFLLRNEPSWVRLGFAFLCPMLIETFGPLRYAYADVTVAPIVLLVLGMALAAEPLDRTTRALIAGLAAVCVSSAIAAVVLPPLGKLIMAVSLARWLCLLIGLNLFFLWKARRKQASPTCAAAAGQ